MARLELTGNADVKKLRKAVNKYKLEHDCKSQLEVLEKLIIDAEKWNNLEQDILEKTRSLGKVSSFSIGYEPRDGSNTISIQDYPFNPNSVPAGFEDRKDTISKESILSDMADQGKGLEEMRERNRETYAARKGVK